MELSTQLDKSGVLKFSEEHEESPAVGAKVFDGGAIINMLSPREGMTFGDCAHNILLPFVETHLKNANRLDIGGIVTSQIGKSEVLGYERRLPLMDTHLQIGKLY